MEIVRIDFKIDFAQHYFSHPTYPGLSLLPFFSLSTGVLAILAQLAVL